MHEHARDILDAPYPQGALHSPSSANLPPREKSCPLTCVLEGNWSYERAYCSHPALMAQRDPAIHWERAACAGGSAAACPTH